jgi:carbamoyltransferase
MYVLAIAVDHDLSVCLLRDGDIAVHIEEERLTRVKHGLPLGIRGLWGRFADRFGYVPWASIRYCLDAVGIGLDDVDIVALPDGRAGRAAAELLPLRDRSRLFLSDDPPGGAHHYRHALSAFYASEFDSAAVLVIDGDGSTLNGAYEAESGYVFRGRNGAYQEIFKNRYQPFTHERRVFRPGLGWMYDYVSTMLGFTAVHTGLMAEPGKTMGLAPYGRPTDGEPWVRHDRFALDFAGFWDWAKRTGMVALIDYDSRDRALVRSERDIGAEAQNLAYRVQQELEVTVLHLATELHAATGERNLCLAGGVALNSVANGILARSGPFERIFIQPAAADNGQAIGLAYHAHLARRPTRLPLRPIRHAYGGRPYAEAEIAALLDEAGIPFCPAESGEHACQRAASALADRQVVGWFQGGSEYGPRALGHRSILADPRPPWMKDHLNHRVKFREPFRPFAPSVLAERAAEVFGLDQPSPFMLIVADVRPEWRDRVPAITHVDGTARLQTVDRQTAPLFHELIRQFERETGIPLVLNTSFNLRGMPIVETPADALQCFLYTEMERLFLGRFDLRQPPAAALRPVLAPGWTIRIIHERWSGARARRAELYHPGDRARLELPPDPPLWTALLGIDGERSIADLAADIGSDDVPNSIELITQWVRRACRRGALKLRTGRRLF